MAPLLKLCILALAGMTWALPQPAQVGSNSKNSLRAPDCGMTSTDVDLLSFNGCTLAAEACHYCCTTWDDDGDSCHDDADPHPGGLCPGNRVIHCGVHNDDD